MDIIDIMLARAMTPQGQTEIYVNKANKAAAVAELAKTDAATAIAAVEDAANEIAAAKEEANDLLEAAQEALETAQSAQINTLDTEDVDDEIKKLTFTTNMASNSTANTVQLIATYPDNTLHTENVVKMYKSSGDNEDGTMTQKAIKAYMSTYSGGGGGVSNLGSENAGNIVVIGPDGNIIASGTSESSIIEALIKAGTYVAEHSVGLDIDYENKSFVRTQEAVGKSAGSNFDIYAMYGGRKRCNVANDGTINAFYGEAGYTEDGSNGLVMIYQPKFYYLRVPIKLTDNTVGNIIRRESLIISPIYQTGFKLHPLFKNGEEELDYVLLSAYEGSLDNGMLTSVAGTKPASSVSVENFENAARARGTGWHITNMLAESALQMLEIVEFGNMNGQVMLESGVSNLNGTNGINSSSITGSTAGLGNATGHADSTVNESNGVSTTYSEAGKRAISYRGMENPWGNLWRFVGGTYVSGNGYQGSGVPYICNDFEYNYERISSNYGNTNMNFPSVYGWINAMARGASEYDWVFIPAECERGANSAVPVGDNLYSIGSLFGTAVLTVGGAWYFQDKNGPFFYACDRILGNDTQYGYGARLMYIPTKGTIYNNNIAKWTQIMGG